MQQLFRFIQRVTSAVTPTFNSLITVGDTVPTVFSKLQALLGIRSLRTVLVSTYTGGNSTTTDQSVISLVVPSGYNQPGNLFIVKLSGTWRKPRVNGTSINIWVKINGVKEFTLNYVPTTNINTYPFTIDMTLINRTVGPTGSYAIAGTTRLSTNSNTNFVLVDSEPVVATVDTTNDVTITVGYDFSNSNSNNEIVITAGYIKMG